MTEMPSATFAQHLRARRQAMELTQTELGRLVSEHLGSSMDGSAVTRVEKGERAVKLDEAVAICTVLNVELASMLVATSSVERMLHEQRAALIVATEAFEAARKEMGRLQLVVLHLEELQGQGVREADIPKIAQFHVE